MNNFTQFLNHYSKYVLKKEHKHLVLHVTNHCNFRCAHCFVDFETIKKDQKKDYFIKIANKFKNLLWLDIGGGEPFLRKDLYEIVNLFNKQIVSIPTNGFLTDQILEQVKRIDTSKCELTINFSVDGLKETHNKIRKNEQSWNKIWETFEKLKSQSKAKLRVITVINNQNFHEIIPLMKEIKKKEIDFHSVMLLRGETLDDEVELPPLNDLKEISKDIFDILEGYDYGLGQNSSSMILRNYHRYLWKVSLDILEKKEQVIPCTAGKSHLVIWGNGDLSSCEMLPSVGNINSNDIDEILLSKKFRDQKRSILNKECHCTHNCALLTSIMFNPLEWKNLIHQKKPKY